MKPLATNVWNQVRRLERPLVDGLFVVLLLALVVAAGWLVARHDRYWDWTATADNSLTHESLAILERLEGSLRVTVFAAADSQMGKAIERLLTPYVQVLPDLEIGYLDPQLFPERARDADVSLVGQILLEYRGRRETLKEVSERSMAAAIARLTETRSPWVAVIEGHGERAIEGGGGSDLGRLGRELRDHGFLARPLDLAKVKEVPNNTQLVILSTPRIPLFPGEADALIRFLDRGGNLLWLLDPGPMKGLEPLATRLGLTILPGVVVDAAGADWGVETPAVAVIASYPAHPLSEGLATPALLPGCLAFEAQATPGWTLSTYLATGQRSWNETGQLMGRIDRDEVVGELPGPLPVVLALTRSLPEAEREQRVLVVGDGDFLSNAHLGTHGNRALGMRLLRWLSSGEGLLELPPAPAAAEPLTLDGTRQMLVGLGALVLLPGLFLTFGLVIRWGRWRER